MNRLALATVLTLSALAPSLAAPGAEGRSRWRTQAG